MQKKLAQTGAGAVSLIHIDIDTDIETDAEQDHEQDVDEGVTFGLREAVFVIVTSFVIYYGCYVCNGPGAGVREA